MKFISFIAVFFCSGLVIIQLQAQSDAMKEYSSKLMINLRSSLVLQTDCDCAGYDLNSSSVLPVNFVELDGQTYEVSDDARWMLGQLNQLPTSEKCCLLHLIRNVDRQITQPSGTSSLPFSITDFGLAITGLNPYYVGNANAYGLWGLGYLPAVAGRLRIDSVYDERMNPEKSAVAAGKYLEQLHESFGAWSLAIDAYIEGPATVRRMVESRQLLGANFAPFDAFIACILFSNTFQDFIMSVVQSDAEGCDTVIIQQKIHLRQIGEYLSIPFDTLKMMNPEVFGEVVYGNLNPIMFRLPAGYAPRFITAADSIAMYRDTVFFSKPVQTAIKKNEVVYKVAPGTDYDKISYTIQSGDNLGAIAEKFGVNVNDLRDWNDINGNTIYTGKNLVVYVKKGSSQAKQEPKPVEKSQETSKPSPPTVLQGYFLKDTYVVQKGDSPYTIAEKYQGVSAENIMEWNGISKPSQLQIGQKLKIYGKK